MEWELDDEMCQILAEEHENMSKDSCCCVSSGPPALRRRLFGSRGHRGDEDRARVCRRAASRARSPPAARPHSAGDHAGPRPLPLGPDAPPVQAAHHADRQLCEREGKAHPVCQKMADNGCKASWEGWLPQRNQFLLCVLRAGCSCGPGCGLLDLSLLSVRGERAAHLPHQHPELPAAAAWRQRRRWDSNASRVWVNLNLKPQMTIYKWRFKTEKEKETKKGESTLIAEINWQQILYIILISKPTKGLCWSYSGFFLQPQWSPPPAGEEPRKRRRRRGWRSWSSVWRLTAAKSCDISSSSPCPSWLSCSAPPASSGRWVTFRERSQQVHKDFTPTRLKGSMKTGCDQHRQNKLINQSNKHSHKTAPEKTHI